MIGPISPDVKQMGARSAGNPHAACDVEGAGNVARSGCLGQLARQSSTLPGKPFFAPARSQVRTSVSVLAKEIRTCMGLFRLGVAAWRTGPLQHGARANDGR